MTTDNHIAAPSFDRMRNMLVRAAEVRESEQQQIFDALDDIYARLAPVDSLGAVRKRLSELPDRTEVGVLAERLDEAMSRLEAQDNAIAALTRAIESLPDKLAKPFAQLDGRLDGVAARFEGVAGRMDGLEDKLQNIHRRLDELGGHLDKQDAKLDSIPQAVTGPVRERIEQAEGTLRDRVDHTDHELRGKVDELSRVTQERVGELGRTTHERIDANTEALKVALTETGEMIDASDRLENLGNRLETVTTRLDDLTGRLDKVEDGFRSGIGDLDGALKAGLSKVEGTLSKQPDTDSVDTLVRKSNDESVRRIGGQLDEAMATFAELMLGGGPAVQQIAPPPPAPRQPRRSSRNGRAPKPADAKAKSGEGAEEATE
ncbi:PA containing protein [Amycolatopsis sp. SID8362]|uniref:PA containing protein n=1 Tax=Amycolatopsis sp. SID8362 TaxID=2690346 RepID=UPI00136BBA11|nr:PA containing protein [Amycolatopsis sp. SID8362]NBH08047.1 PA containing protein [Amycolatopsis sp. SID8362]NED44741.1 PA containing protein [Amycolatopsis sp. SID8362]